MPFGINNPLPSSMKSELKKAARVLASFVDPRQALSPDKIIPPEILANAKGLAILTVIKAGFLGSGRFGSGIVVARLGNGQWSAPSALATGGAGFGGQIGFELTDFVFVLNDNSAVKAFSQQGSITLGANVSIAAGPVGRNAEAAGAASLKGVAGVFSYSKTKGLFAGVSIEGSVLVERRDANEKLYGSRITARQLLEGGVQPPIESDALMRVLNSRVFAGGASSHVADNMYNDIPIYDDSQESPTGRASRPASTDFAPADRSASWQHGPKSPSSSSFNRSNTTRADPNATFDQIASSNTRRSTIGSDYGDRKPSRPTAPKPHFKPRPGADSLGQDQAVALFAFEPAQPGDLGFKKGDVITILKRTENETDWWTGRVGDKEGIFPSNYVSAKS